MRRRMIPNAARIMQIEEELRNLRSNREDEFNARRRTQERLETLKSARAKLKKLMESYFNFPTEFSKLHTSVMDFDLQGSRRRNIEARLNTIGDSLKTQRTNHQENSQAIQSQITAEATEELRHNSTISSLNVQITALEKERRLLLAQ